MDKTSPNTPEENPAPKENEVDKNTQPTELKDEELNDVSGGIMFVSEKFKQQHGINCSE